MVCCCWVDWLASPCETRRKELWQKPLSIALVDDREVRHTCNFHHIKVLLLCYAAFKTTC
jgi:hypothetical protein